MKKKLTLILIAISILTMAVSMAAAPVGKQFIRLRGMNFVGNQLIMKFDARGFSSSASFPASININQQRYGLNCTFDGVKKLVCNLPNANRYAGKRVSVWIAGYITYAKIPAK